MSKVIQQYRIHGVNILPHKTQEGSVVAKIPAGYYKVEFHPMMGFYLTKQNNSVDIPSKIYGSTLPRAERIWNTFDKSDKPLGIGLFGTKGAGKTLLSNVIAKQAIEERGLPVIDVSATFSVDPDYLDFLNSLGEIVIIFDEFIKRLGSMAKNTDRENRETSTEIARKRQDEMLPFFSGTNNQKRMIIMIDNSSYGLSEFITNRPGRMRYTFNYAGVEEAVVRAVCSDSGINNISKVDELVTYSQRNSCSFDMINEIIREMVEYPEEKLAEITSIMNVPSMAIRKSKKAEISDVDFSVFENDYKNIQLKEALVTVKENGRFNLIATYDNPFKGLVFENSNDFDEHEMSNYCSYSDYKKCTSLDKLEKTFEFRVDHLTSIKGNLRKYSNGYLTVQLSFLEDEDDTDFQSFAWM